MAIYFSPTFKTDIRNYLDRTQMLQIFGFIFLPGCALSIIASLLIYFVPSVKLSGNQQTAKMVIDIIIIIAAILILVMPGIFLVSQGSRISFCFVKVRKQLIMPDFISNISRSTTEWT